MRTSHRQNLRGCHQHIRYKTRFKTRASDQRKLISEGRFDIQGKIKRAENDKQQIHFKPTNDLGNSNNADSLLFSIFYKVGGNDKELE